MASGYLFDFDLVDRHTAKKRIIALWTPGARVFELDNAAMIKFPAPLPTKTSHCSGLPLVLESGSNGTFFLALPLLPEQLEEMNPPSQSVIRLKHGIILVEATDKEVDPAMWLDIDLCPVLPDKQINLKPQVEESLLNDEEFDARASLTGETKPDPEMLEFLDLIKNSPQKDQVGDGRAQSSGVSLSGWLDELFSMMFGKDRLTRKNPGQKAKSGPGQELNLQLGLMRFLNNTGILQVFIQRQQQYILKMIDLFERGDWSEALKRGIPLAGKTEQPDGLSFGIPSIRDKIEISLERSQARESLLSCHPELFEHLRDLYRKSVEHLTNAGRYKDAAFVLADLLGESEEAVSYLERHGEFTLAAQLAEARKLRPAIIVRQWFIAGDIKRTVLIARLTGVFPEAIRLLDKEHRELADALRTFWASHLAESGQYVGAAIVAMDLPDMQHLVLEWTRLALKSCESRSGELLAKLLERSSSSDWPLVKEQVNKLLDDESRELASARLAFAENLTSTNPETLIMARKAARCLLRDHGMAYINVEKRLLKALTVLADDEALKTDLLRCSLALAKLSLKEREELLFLEFGKGDIGTDPVLDALMLNDGRVVAALGEAGMVILDTSGIRVKHFSIPAYELVISKNSDRLIALARRGDSLHMSRVDLLQLTAEDFGQELISAYATNYDGSLWYAAYQDQFYIVDATLPKFKTIWRMPGIKALIASISCDEKSCSFATIKETVSIDHSILSLSEIWYCQLPELQLRRRYQTEGDLYNNEIHPRRALMTPNGEPVNYVLCKDESYSNNTLAVRFGNRVVRDFPCQSILEESLRVSTINAWTVVSFCQMDDEASRNISSVLFLLDMLQGKTCLQLKFQGAQQLNHRILNNFLTVCDNRGRIVVIDLRDGTLTRSLRL